LEMVGEKKMGISGGTDHLEAISLGTVNCIQMKNGDVRLTPRRGAIVSSLMIGLVVLVIATIVGILAFSPTSATPTPVTFDSISRSILAVCGVTLLGLYLAGVGLAVGMAAVRGILLPSVVFSATSQMATISHGLFGKKVYSLERDTKLAILPISHIWVVTSTIARGMLMIGVAFAAAFTHNRRADTARSSTFGAGIEDLLTASNRIALQSSDGQSYDFTIIPDTHIPALRRILTSVMADAEMIMPVKQ
jgi:hypothetical protein